MKWIGRAFALFGAACFSQFPQFYMQYLHELAGHISELTYQVNLLRHSARLSGKTLEELIAKFLQFSDSDVVRQGEFMKSMVERLERLTLSQSSLVEAPLFTKSFFFIREADATIALETYHRFQLGFIFNLEGVLYALIGIILGYSLFLGIRAFFSLFRKKPGSSGEPG